MKDTTDNELASNAKPTRENHERMSASDYMKLIDVSRFHSVTFYYDYFQKPRCRVSVLHKDGTEVLISDASWWNVLINTPWTWIRSHT